MMGSPTSSDSEKFAHDLRMRNLMRFAQIAEPKDRPRLTRAMDDELDRCHELGCSAPVPQEAEA
jgi:hypothetical protein